MLIRLKERFWYNTVRLELYIGAMGTFCWCPILKGPKQVHSFYLSLVYVCWELDTIEQLHLHALEKEVATHSSVLFWRIPGTAEPGGLPPMGSHRVGHDWSDLAATAAVYIVNILKYMFKIFM